MTYSEKLKDPRWQRKRLEVLQRDDFTCNWCGDKETTLHVHHELYEGKDPWDTDNDFLTTLCEDCHSIEHFDYTELERFLISVWRNRDRFNIETIRIGNKIIRQFKTGIEEK